MRAFKNNRTFSDQYTSFFTAHLVECLMTHNLKADREVRLPHIVSGTNNSGLLSSWRVNEGIACWCSVFYSFMLRQRSAVVSMQFWALENPELEECIFSASLTKSIFDTWSCCIQRNAKKRKMCGTKHACLPTCKCMP